MRKKYSVLGGFAQVLSFIVALTSAQYSCCATANASPIYQIQEAGQNARQLEPDKPIDQELAGNRPHYYKVNLSFDQYLHISVDQQGIDIVLTLFGPEGNKIIETDSLNGAEGAESLSCVAEVSGSYLIEVRSFEKNARAGHYVIRIDELREATSSDRPLVEAVSLYQQSLSLSAKREYREALPLAERVLSIREKFLGPEHPDVLSTLDLLAGLSQMTGNLERAETTYARTVALAEKNYGPLHPTVAFYLDRLARIFESKGSYSQAEALLTRSLTIRENAFGREHLDICESLSRMGWMYLESGNYAKSEAHYARALAIIERTLGPEHPKVVDLVGALAQVYSTRGDYEKAEEYYLRALDIQDKTTGSETARYADYLSRIAWIYERHGAYFKAEEFFTRALTIIEKTRGPEDPNLIGYLSALAWVCEDRSDISKAEEFMVRALRIAENSYGPTDYKVGYYLQRLAWQARLKGDYEKAESFLSRALVLYEKAFGPNISSNGTLSGLAWLYEKKGDYSKAELFLLRVVKSLEARFGQDHLRLVASLDNIARFYRVIGNTNQALIYQTRANEIRERFLRLNLTSTSERQKLLYLNFLTKDLDQTLSLHLLSAPNDKAATRLALTTLLRRKGRALDAMVDELSALRQYAYPEDRQLIDQLAETRSQLATAIILDVTGNQEDQSTSAIRELQNRVEILEAKVSARSVNFRAQTVPLTLDLVQKTLGPKMALVEFASYHSFYPEADRWATPLGPRRFAAYVLHDQGEPQWVDLGDALPIEMAIKRFRNALKYQPGKRLSDIEGVVKPSARSLEELVISPIRKFLGGVDHLLISPDGSLNLIPFEAIVDQQGHYLVESFSISYLTSGRDLLRFQSPAAGKGATVILFNPDFGRVPNGENKKVLDKKANSGPAPAQSGNSELSKLSFSPLPGTVEEGKKLQELFPGAKTLTHKHATETALKQVEQPAVLHIATHGFFLDNDPIKTEFHNERGLFISRSFRSSSLEYAPSGIQIKNPLLRSGLALANANLKQATRSDDGILTAFEVAGLNLWGTKLVVLSACDTGVGEVRQGEGIFGLRRALVLAGSQTQMISLWQVSDIGTRDLMVNFYQGLLEGKSRTDALRQVQLRMLASSYRKHPFYWASFILSGDWTKLNN